MAKYLHVCNGDKFTAPYVALVNRELNAEDHLFFIAERVVKYPVQGERNVVFLSSFRSRVTGLLNLTRRMNEAEAIVLHGLFGVMLYVLLLQPWLLWKVHWMIWGGDLYVRQDPRRTLGWRFRELARCFIIKRIGVLQTWIEGDARLAKKWYGARGRYTECLMYPSNVFTPMELPPSTCKECVVMVGNSADPSNNHQEVLERLKKIDDGQFKIVCPLSYGDDKYAEYIRQEGQRLFGDRFKALTEFMSFPEYKLLLSQVDVAIFAHNRQQGMGNAITLLGLGKKLYIRKGITPWEAFVGKGVKVYDYDSLDLQPISPDVAQENMRLIEENFSEKVLVKQLRENVFPTPLQGKLR